MKTEACSNLSPLLTERERSKSMEVEPQKQPPFSSSSASSGLKAAPSPLKDPSELLLSSPPKLELAGRSVSVSGHGRSVSLFTSKKKAAATTNDLSGEFCKFVRKQERLESRLALSNSVFKAAIAAPTIDPPVMRSERQEVSVVAHSLEELKLALEAHEGGTINLTLEGKGFTYEDLRKKVLFLVSESKLQLVLKFSAPDLQITADQLGYLKHFFFTKLESVTFGISARSSQELTRNLQAWDCKSKDSSCNVTFANLTLRGKGFTNLPACLHGSVRKLLVPDIKSTPGHFLPYLKSVFTNLESVGYGCTAQSPQELASIANAWDVASKATSIGVTMFKAELTGMAVCSDADFPLLPSGLNELIAPYHAKVPTSKLAHLTLTKLTVGSIAGSKNKGAN